MTEREYSIDELTIPIEAIGVSDKEKQALELLDAFIVKYNKEKQLPEDIQSVEAALDMLLVTIKREKMKAVGDRNKHFEEIAWRADFTLSILAHHKVSAARCFQYALCCYLAIKKRQGVKTPNKLKCGKIERTIADDLARTSLYSINWIYQFMHEAQKRAEQEGNEVLSKKITDCLDIMLTISKEEAGNTVQGWSKRFLELMAKNLQDQGLGKVYVENGAIFVQLGDSNYKARPFYEQDEEEGWLPNEEYLQMIIETNITGAMIEMESTRSLMQISPHITHLSDHLKKIDFFIG